MKTIQLLQNKKFFAALTVAAIPIIIILTIIVSLLLCYIHPIVGISSLFLFILIFFKVFKNYNVANGRIDFINLDNNTLYIITRGIFKFKYKKIKFNNFTKISCEARIALGGSGAGVGSHRRFVIKGTIDECEYDLYVSLSRGRFNSIVTKLINTYGMRVEYHIDKSDNEDYPFTDNTSYSYSYRPFSYLFGLSIGAFFFIVSMVLIGDNICLSIIFFVHSGILFVFSYNAYFKSKREIVKIKNDDKI